MMQELGRDEWLRLSRSQRAERWISIARAVLAGCALAAIWLDPSEPSRYVEFTYATLSAYFIYAIALAIIAHLARALPARWGLSVHVVDLAAFSALMFLTEGPVSPFFAYFAFSIVAAMLRWQSRGVIYTAAYAITAFLLMGMHATGAPSDFQLNRFIIRASYLAVVASLLGYVARHQERTQRDLARLASWPRHLRDQIGPLVTDVLREVAAISRAERALIVWAEDEEPWVYSTLRSHGEEEHWRDPPGSFGTLVAEPLTDASLLCADIGAERPPVLVSRPEGIGEWAGAPIDEGLARKFSMRSVLSWPLRGEGYRGRLFVLDKRSTTVEDLLVGEIVARLAASHLEHFYLLDLARGAAVAEERNRLARDLHDSLLQSLSLVSQQVGTLLEHVPGQASSALQRLRDIKGMLATELTELRSFIGDLKPSRMGGRRRPFDLGVRLGELCRQIERQSGLNTQLRLDGVPGRVSGPLAHEIYSIVHEGLVNTARHAGASMVVLDLRLVDGRTVISIADNGRGFPFKGQYDLAALEAMKVGPATMKGRVTELGGKLVITSSERGSTLEIEIPPSPQAI